MAMENEAPGPRASRGGAAVLHLSPARNSWRQGRQPVGLAVEVRWRWSLTPATTMSRGSYRQVCPRRSGASAFRPLGARQREARRGGRRRSGLWRPHWRRGKRRGRACGGCNNSHNSGPSGSGCSDLRGLAVVAAGRRHGPALGLRSSQGGRKNQQENQEAGQPQQEAPKKGREEVPKHNPMQYLPHYILGFRTRAPGPRTCGGTGSVPRYGPTHSGRTGGRECRCRFGPAALCRSHTSTWHSG